MKILLILLILLIIVILLKKIKESFTIPKRKINVACIYVYNKPDELDYKFINKYKNDVKFYIVNSVDPNSNKEWNNKIKNIKEIIYIERENKGWDTTAWKETILKYYNELSKYDLVILANNSNSYDFDLRNLCTHAIDYDMYGLKDANEYWNHFQSYFIVIHKHLFTSDDFKNYWKNMPQINNREDAIHQHELKFKPHFDNLGYKLGVYDITKINPYIKTDKTRPYNPETIKKIALTDLYHDNLKKNFKY